MHWSVACIQLPASNCILYFFGRLSLSSVESASLKVKLGGGRSRTSGASGAGWQENEKDEDEILWRSLSCTVAAKDREDTEPGRLADSYGKVTFWEPQMLAILVAV